MKAENPDILELLIRHEAELGVLYGLFGDRFPTHADFWRGIARDERRHAEWLDSVHSLPAVRNWFLSRSQVKSAAILSSINFVKTQMDRLKRGQVSLVEALSVARDLENAVLEKQLSKLGGPVPPEVRSILMGLIAETEQHRKLIIDALGAEKRRSP